VFGQEGGGHRYQRVPPTEKRGRVQTSTITVAVLPAPSETQVRIDERDVDWQATRGSGAGGQHRNKTDSAVQVWHRPTGIMVRCEAERSQHQNLATAMALLRTRLAEAAGSKAHGDRNATRRAQIGSGQRGDKVRTIRVRDGVVTDHRTDHKWDWDQYRRGVHLG
jgi:peptide chain release factor 1